MGTTKIDESGNPIKILDEVNPTQEAIRTMLENMSEFLVEKNKRYGNSAISPITIFTKHMSKESAASTNSILVRLDDKLSRIKNADELRQNDVQDMIGYLVLLCISKEKETGDSDWIDPRVFLD